MRLKEMKRKSGLTTKQIADGSGIPEPTLEKLFSGATKEPKLPTMQQLVHFLGYTLNDLASENVFSLQFIENRKKKENLLRIFEKLNGFGQERVIEYASLLASKEEYINQPPRSADSKEKEKSKETVKVFVAARSKDNSEPAGWVDMPAEEVERIFSLPESETDL